MGIYSEINLFKPSGGVFQPGGVVAGVIKYSVNEPTEFTKITVSLKGHGFLRAKDYSSNRRGGTNVYKATEQYIDDDVTHEGDGKETPIGSYEINFNFNLPRNIPSSLHYSKSTKRYSIRCDVVYYVRIKFERPGWFSFTKHYKKGIKVTSAITPRLPKESLIYGHHKKLTQLFSSKTSIVKIKANMLSSVVAPGDKIKLEYEVFNDTNVEIKSVATKLMEEYTFLPIGHTPIKIHEDIPGTDGKTGTVACGATQVMPVEITPPSDLFSLDHSEIVKKDYVVSITVETPMPHRNAVLMMPVQVGHEEGQVTMPNDNLPPPYWEAMREGKEKSGSGDEDEEEDEKSCELV